MDDTQKAVEPTTDLNKAMAAVPAMNVRPPAAPASAAPAGFEGRPEKAKKERAKRRAKNLVVGTWQEVVLENGTKTRAFVPAPHQPEGKALREVADLAAWLARPETSDIMLSDRVTQVSALRTEFVSATFQEVRVKTTKVVR